MTGTDFLVIGIVLLIVGSALFYIIRAKRKGRKCIGCPGGNGCSGCSCGCSDKNKSEVKNK